MRVRRPDILRFARDQACQWCGKQDGSVVAAHSNWFQWGGKGMGRKASDWAVAYLCGQCHFSIDQSARLTKSQRQTIWLAAHRKTITLLREAGLLEDDDVLGAGEASAEGSPEIWTRKDIHPEDDTGL